MTPRTAPGRNGFFKIAVMLSCAAALAFSMASIPVAALPKAEPQEAPEPSLPQSRVSGIVLESGTDRPLAGASVAALLYAAWEIPWGMPLPRPDSAIATVTDAAGRFTLDLSPGRYRVVSEMGGFVDVSSGWRHAPRYPGVWVQLPVATQVENVELRMAREAVIAGQVLDVDGRQPSTPLSVSLLQNGFNIYGGPSLQAVLPSVRLDDLGRYRFTGVPPGEYYVRTSGAPPVGERMATYHPGTTDENRATAVRVEPGEEVRLDPMTVQPIDTSASVRFSFAPVEVSSPFVTRSVTFGNQSTLFLPPSAANSRVDRLEVQNIGVGSHNILFQVLDRLNGSLLYSRLTVHLPGGLAEQFITLNRGVRVAGSTMFEGADGSRSAGPDIGCSLWSDASEEVSIYSSRCTGELIPGLYKLSIQSPLQDAYVVSAQSAGRDILADGLQVETDTEFEVLLSSPGGVIDGRVQDGLRNIPHAVVALVPDAPYRNAGVLYHAVISDINGGFELRGIRPGGYRLFAWKELNGSAYRNAEFIASFEDRGRPVTIGREQRISMDVDVIE